MVTRTMSRMEEAVERVLSTGELPDVPFEPGAPVPVAFWRAGESSLVFFIVRRTDGSFHHLVVSGYSGDLAGGPLGDDLPDRTELALYAEVWLGRAKAVIGFAPEGAETVEFANAGSQAGVNPRNGAFVVGVAGVTLPHSDRLVARPLGIEVPIEFEDDVEIPDIGPGFVIEDKVWPPQDG
jgi:hypothetical protein